MIRRFFTQLLALVGITSRPQYTAGPLRVIRATDMPPTHQPHQPRGRMSTRTLSPRAAKRRRARLRMQKRSRRINRGLLVK